MKHLREQPAAAYVHFPFCASKCFYCDFGSYPGMDALFHDYVDALTSEIARAGDDSANNRLDSVYFGGGTPTVLSARELVGVLRAIEANIGISPGSEITVEANPGTVDPAKLTELRDGGFNRLSLGVQSFDDAMLSRIGRIHAAGDAVDAYNAARGAGFENVGIDLIFALPGQTLTDWHVALTKAVELAPEHLALYELSIEEGTRFAELCAQGLLDLPDEDTRLAMYQLAIERITAEGYEHYEVSNFARPGFRSRHNQVYWRNEPYYGFGAGATSYLAGTRSRRVGDPRTYIREISSGGDAVESSECLAGRAWLAETIIQGIRMLDGIDLRAFQERTGVDIEDEFRDEISGLVSRGLLQVMDGRMRVTRQGLFLMNDVAMEFLPG